MKRFLVESSEVSSRLESRDSCFGWFDGRILDAAGFLVYSEIFTFLKTLPEIAAAGNAIIIAEGGMGKTFILDEFCKSVPDTEVEKLDLVLYSGNVPRLEQDIENAKTTKYLLIDGVDEATELCPALLQTLKRVNPSAHVIIASRSIPQLKAFCETLQWPLFSLLPYTENDVRELCEAERKDYSTFIREVEGHGLGGVCAKPLGCKMLLSSFDGSKLTATDGETMWRNALMRLCGENTCSQTRSLVKDSCIPERECWDLSIRVALILKLSGQSIVTRISSWAESSKATIDFSQFMSNACYAKLNECLLRPIFTPIDHDCFRFSHSSYFDFMAAMGLVKLVEPSEWEKIVLSKDGVPYPQWEGVIPWLAVRHEALLGRVKKSRPDLLLGSDAVVTRVGAGEICKSILENAESIPTSIRENPAVQARFYALGTDDCIQPLEGALKGDSTATVDTAIDIVRRARILPMVDALVDFFIDDSKDISLRVNAGYALVELANNAQRKRCRAVLSQSMPKRLKGVALRLLWPDCMTAKELTPLLTPGEDHVLDSYEYWLEYEFLKTLERLKEEDARELLSWAISDVKYDKEGEHHFFAAKKGVFLHCWVKYFTQEYFGLLAKGLEAFSKIYRSPFRNHSVYDKDKNAYDAKAYSADDSRRRCMARFIVEDESLSLSPLTDFDIQLLQHGDIDFILDEMNSCETPSLRQRWAECLANLASWIELPKWSDVWNRLHKEFPEHFALDAKQMQDERKKTRRTFRDIENREKKQASIQERKEADILAKNAAWVHEKLQSGDATGHFSQIMWVILTQTKGEITDFRLDFRKSSLWPTFSKREQETLIHAAYGFILECNGPWSEGNEYHPSYVQAFYLLMAYDKNRLEQLPPAVWKIFAPELLQALNYDTFDLVPLTLKYFAEHQPEVFFDGLVQKITKQLSRGNGVDIHQFKDIINPQTFLSLLKRLDVDTLTDEQRQQLYNAFWRIDPEQTSRYIAEKWPREIAFSECGILTSAFVLANDPQKRMPELLQLLNEKPEWGRDWVINVIGQDEYSTCSMVNLLHGLSVLELKVLYAWLADNYPPEKAPHHAGCYSPCSLDYVYSFINHVFNELTSRVDIALPQALEDLLVRFPRISYLKDCILQARRKLIEKECPTYDVDTIKRLIANKGGMVVHTPDDLLMTVCETLRKYQTLLQGKENPMIGFLWNDHGDSVSHKDEESFSNHIKAFLDANLPEAVINREVQLNRGTGEAPGARTDIWITAFSKMNGSRIRLCVEVKGSWNRQCKTAFKDQLCEKYMGAGGADAGIYLVGWFSSTRAKDNRNQWKDIDDARQYLKEQEISLREQGYNVRSVVIDCTY